MIAMADLPDPSQNNNAPVAAIPAQKTVRQDNLPPADQQISVGGISKEVSGGISASFSELGKPVEVGKDIDLPKEVESAGVTQSRTVVEIPPVLRDAGVKPAGQNVTLGNGNTVKLPLTDTEIAEGLKKSLSDSWHWLAQWCRRKLQQINISVKSRKI